VHGENAEPPEAPLSVSSFTRRDFLIAASVALPLITRPQRPLALAVKKGPHPTPRPGIDASRVLAPDDLAGFPRALEPFDHVRQIPEIVDGIRCQCGCAEMKDHYSLLSCYEGKDAMAKWCPVCQSEGQVVFRLHKERKSLDEIRAAIDKEFGS